MLLRKKTAATATPTAPTPAAKTEQPQPQLIGPAHVDHPEGYGSRIKDYSFSDLYLTLDWAERPLIRQLHLRKSGGRVLPGITPAPEALHDDLMEMAKQIRDECIQGGKIARDMQLVYDGATYRCALIAEPNVDPKLHDENFAARTRWCLRRFEDNLPELTNLNLPGHVVQALRGAFNSRGLILISGAFGSGKTTTATASILNWCKTSSEVAVTLEDPPEYALPTDIGDGRIYQIDIANQNPADAVKHVRRMAPRYVFLGEIRTPEAARELIHLAASGPLVICTIHASDPASAISSLALFSGSAMGEDLARQMISKSLSMVVYQSMSGGSISADVLRVEPEDFALQHKIREGRFDMLKEHLDTQNALRENRGKTAIR